MKQVKIKKYEKGFGWDLKARDFAECKCIMAIAKEKQISYNDLIYYRQTKVITNAEYEAITSFDQKIGTNDHLITISILAQRLNVEVIIS